MENIKEELKKIYDGAEKDSFFREAADLLIREYDLLETGADDLSLEELKKLNDSFYRQFDMDSYAKSYADPAYAVGKLGTEKGRFYSALMDMFIINIRRAFRGEAEPVRKYIGAFIDIAQLENSGKTADEQLEYFVSFRHEIAEDIVRSNVNTRYLPDKCLYAKMLSQSDPCDLRLLYRYGLRVTDIELKTAEFINSLCKEDVEAMAATFVNGYIRGFEAYRIDLSVKNAVEIRYPIGFERMVAIAARMFAEHGLAASVVPESISDNKQRAFDHRFDMALYLDEESARIELEAARKVYDSTEGRLRRMGGPAVIEYFGEPDFEPVRKEEACALSESQRALSIKLNNDRMQLFEQYLPGEERSFTIIAYPLPTIGEHFEEIFKETVRVNTLDSMTYRNIQQKLIDALDGGRYVRVRGMNGNRTDITVQLHELPDPSKQSNFENCIDDVNIPVGEVFTSPILKGTDGILHVSEVFLSGLKYTNLFLEVKDGMVSDYGCDNFDNPEDGRKLIYEDILHNHESVPIGEFAIGTNTTAYMMGIRYDIQAKLPILIAEKTGPHFAFGDTCYSYSEDHVVYNPDGKEIYARDNELTLENRKTNPDKAYFNCHTDVTLPYNELGEITVYGENGYEVTLIKNGRFVLPGTEELNRPLE